MNSLKLTRCAPSSFAVSGKAIAVITTLILTAKVIAAEPETGPIKVLWESPDHDIVFYAGPDHPGVKVCPRVTGSRAQPFCRQFPASVLAACGDKDGVFMVLANGDIHRVNRFLIGPRGELQPQHRPAAPADFLEAWIPHAACKQRNSLPPVFAISQGKVPWHFDGTHWSAMPLPHTGAVASNK